MAKELPVYRIFIDPEKGLGDLQMNSSVFDPAHQKNFFSFGKDKKHMSFNDSEQTIIGVAIAPDIELYRNMPEMGEFMVTFGKDDIKNMALWYGKSLNWNKLTMEHDNSKPIESAVMIYSYIINSSKGLTAPEMFKNEKDGTWLIGYKFTEKKEYDYVKENFTGWSVEGDFLLEEMQKFKNQIKMAKNEMTIKEWIKSIFSAKQKLKFGEATLEDGNQVVWEGDELVEGETAIFLVTEDGETPAPDGTHTTTEGAILTTEGGILQTVGTVEEDFENEGLKKLSERIDKLEKASTSSEEFAKNSDTKELKEKVEALEKENKTLKESFEKLEKKASKPEGKKKVMFKSEDNSNLKPHQKAILNRMKNAKK